jgi:hypothetical protein
MVGGESGKDKGDATPPVVWSLGRRWPEHNKVICGTTAGRREVSGEGRSMSWQNPYFQGACGGWLKPAHAIGGGEV